MTMTAGTARPRSRPCRARKARTAPRGRARPSAVLPTASPHVRGAFAPPGGYGTRRGFQIAADDPVNESDPSGESSYTAFGVPSDTVRTYRAMNRFRNGYHNVYFTRAR